MHIDGVLFLAVGVVALLLPRSAAYRQHLVQVLERRAEAQVPHSFRPALETLVVRRALAVGVGLLLAGVVIIVLSLTGVLGEEHGGPLFVVTLMILIPALALAAVEIWWPVQIGRGPRAARMATPGLADYLPPVQRVSWVLAVLGAAGVLGGLALAGSEWFDAGTLWRSPLPVLAVAIAVMAVLSTVGIRRVLDAPQPARHEHELYWQDVIRSSTLSGLHMLPGFVGLVSLVVVGAVLDDAASVLTEETGVVGPAWTGVLLVIGYTAPVVVLIIALVATTGLLGEREVAHMRRRLWGGRRPQPEGAGAAAGERS